MDAIQTAGQAKRKGYSFVIVCRFDDKQIPLLQQNYANLKLILTWIVDIKLIPEKGECHAFIEFLKDRQFAEIMNNCIIGQDTLSDILDALLFLTRAYQPQTNVRLVNVEDCRAKLYPSELPDDDGKSGSSGSEIVYVDKPLTLEDIVGDECVKFVIPSQLIDGIAEVINAYPIGMQTWSALSKRKDYTFNLFERRFWPYKNDKDDTWKKVNKTIVRDDYPKQITGNNDAADEYRLEILVSKNRFNNNFAEHKAIAPENYIDLLPDLNIVNKLYELNKRDLAIRLLFRLTVAPANAHIVQYSEFWKITTKLFSSETEDEQFLMYMLHFPLYILCHEETTLFSQVPTNSRVIFTADQAAKFRQFRGVHVQRNPYVQIMTGNEIFTQTLPFYDRDDVRRCVTQEEFNQNFEWFTGGALRGVDFAKFHLAASGSGIRVCRMEIGSHYRLYGDMPETYYTHPLDTQRQELGMTWEQFFETDDFKNIVLEEFIPQDFPEVSSTDESKLSESSDTESSKSSEPKQKKSVKTGKMKISKILQLSDSEEENEGRKKFRSKHGRKIKKMAKSAVSKGKDKQKDTVYDDDDDDDFDEPPKKSKAPKGKDTQKDIVYVDDDVDVDVEYDEPKKSKAPKGRVFKNFPVKRRSKKSTSEESSSDEESSEESSDESSSKKPSKKKPLKKKPLKKKPSDDESSEESSKKKPSDDESSEESSKKKPSDEESSEESSKKKPSDEESSEESSSEESSEESSSEESSDESSSDESSKKKPSKKKPLKKKPSEEEKTEKKPLAPLVLRDPTLERESNVHTEDLQIQAPIENEFVYTDIIKEMQPSNIANRRQRFLAVCARFHPGYESLPNDAFKLICLPPDKQGKFIKPRYGGLSDLDLSIHVDDFAEFERLANELYEAIRANCASRGPVWMQKIPTTKSTKFRIYGPGMTRDFDVFMIKSRSPARFVKSFHLDCVHSWFDGTTTHTFIGGVLSDLCGINRTYRWFSCAKTPGDIVNKYAERGVTTPMNCNERKAYEEYNRISQQTKPLFDAHPALAIWGSVYSSHPWFHMDYWNAGVRFGLRSHPIKLDMITFGLYDRVVQWDTKYGVNLTRFTDDYTSTAVPKFEILNAYLAR